MGDETVLSGRVDSVRRSVSRQSCTLTLSGRDDAAILVDCAAPVFSANQLTLDEVIDRIVRPLGIQRIRIQASGVSRNDKVVIEPGMRAWDALAKAAAGRGLWPWFEPDGTLVVGGPDYTTTPVDTLILKLDGTGNNVMELDDTRPLTAASPNLRYWLKATPGPRRTAKNNCLWCRWISGTRTQRCARYPGGTAVILTMARPGIHNMKAVATDPTVDYYRPQIITQGDTSNMEQVNWRAKKMMSDARLSGLDIVALVAGHRTADGVLWQPGQRVRIVSEPHGIDAIFFLMGPRVQRRPERADNPAPL